MKQTRIEKVKMNRKEMSRKEQKKIEEYGRLNNRRKIAYFMHTFTSDMMEKSVK